MSLYTDTLELIKLTRQEEGKLPLSERELRIHAVDHLLETENTVKASILQALWEAYRAGDHQQHESMRAFILDTFEHRASAATLENYARIIEQVLRDFTIFSKDGILKVTVENQEVALDVDFLLEQKGIYTKLNHASRAYANAPLAELDELPSEKLLSDELESYYQNNIPNPQERLAILKDLAENVVKQGTGEQLKQTLKDKGLIKPRITFNIFITKHEYLQDIVIKDLDTKHYTYIMNLLERAGKINDLSGSYSHQPYEN